ncbi:cupredoxin domain-containing protein [Candidatus Woesearchaeota archaeon]|nr:cupredoxin domain-containing protein [Candidatus Woesearchaeota archaeon]
MSDEIPLKKALFYFVLILLFVGSLFYFKAQQNTTTGNGTNDAVFNGDVQTIDLSFKNYNYYPNTIRVKYNVPVRIIADTNTIRGCMTNINIPDFGISKTVRKGDNIIEFVPNKKGTFGFACPMRMGTGKIIVE